MKKVIPIDPVNPDPVVLSSLGDVIRKGGIIAFPTDTFYGLAVNPFDPEAVARLYALKGRDPLKPILLLVSSMEMFHPLVAEIPPLAKRVMARFWPGPLTLVLKGSRELPDVLMAGTEKIGIRFPDGTLPIRLIEAVGFPLTATSANPSGSRHPPGSAADVEGMLPMGIDHILDGGPSCLPIPSTVLDVSESEPHILREGRISTKMLEKALGIRF